MQNQPNGRSRTWQAAATGGLIALALLTLSLALLGDPKMAENNEMLFPFILVPFAGGLGGLIYTFINSLEFESQQLSIFANFFSVLLYLFLLLIAFTLSLEI